MLLGDLAGIASDSEVTGFAIDHRKVAGGNVFGAFRGSRFNGEDFIADAVASGAVAVVAAPEATVEGVPHLADPEPRALFARLAAKYYAPYPETIVAVTGTNGKSSTVDFLRQIWTHAGKSAASLGTLGAIGPDNGKFGGVIDLGHTTPDPAAVHATLTALAEQGVTHAAMEASSHGLEQHRVDGLSFDGAAFTNLTQDHLDYHQDMASYRDAKMKLWALVKPNGKAIINADAAEGEAFEAGAKAKNLDIVLCGWRAPRDHALKIIEIQPRPNAQTMNLLWQGTEYKVELPLIGEFQAINAVTAATLALALGEQPETVFAGMEKLQPVKGRMEHVGQSKTGGHVFVDYAHTPDGLDVLLRAARPHAPGRIIAVFGCGGDRDTDKRPKMGAIAQRNADVVIVTDDNPRGEEPAAIRAQILKAAPSATEIGDRAQAIREAIAMMKPGDAVMIAGKGHETGQIIKGVTHPFSDQDVARAALDSQT
jgi:UDP-N-acetylmuramoyl-L-alanyl-D-glutamate--2,6-diaminopimelate ligase